jgi:hypothetical protein
MHAKQRSAMHGAVVGLAALALAACSPHPAPPAVADPPAPAIAPVATTADPATPKDAEAIVNKGIRDSGLVTTRDACALLTRPDAEVAVGQPLPQNTTRNLALGMCDYNAADFSAGVSVTVGSWESIKNAATSGNPRPDAISGIGDEALNLNGSNGSSLYVRKGDEGFLLTLNGPKIDSLPDHGLAAETVLAQKVLAKF